MIYFLTFCQVPECRLDIYIVAFKLGFFSKVTPHSLWSYKKVISHVVASHPYWGQVGRFHKSFILFLAAIAVAPFPPLLKLTELE
jgi:hypothetical protein